MSKRKETSTKKPALRKIKTVSDITEYVVTTNGLRVLHVPRFGTGVVTTDIVYFVGSRDEARGETGIAHMFEHMLFKPTSFDFTAKKEAGAMRFEKEIGVVLNANTWKDRTSYFFSYPKAHFDRALRIEAERMHHVLLDAREFVPEQKNVLSEFDMYAGDPQFALAVSMVTAAFESHPYGHETIGFREDIEAYTPEKLERFYRAHYTPENALLIVAGDVTEREMKECVIARFGNLPRSTTFTERQTFREPKQEGLRTVSVERDSTQQILAVGMKHPGFPSTGWFETMVAFDLLAGGEDSILQKALVDSGKAVHLEVTLEPTYETNLGLLFVTIPKPDTHDAVYQLIRKEIDALTIATIKPYLKKTIAKVLMQEALERENSLSYVSALVEYVAAGAWEAFFDSEKILKAITAQDILARIRELADSKNVTLGYFKGTKK
jgi:zinc protease